MLFKVREVVEMGLFKTVCMESEIIHPALSVIVPCYNVEPYLDRSLGCLERQWGNHEDYEIILVNDASVDATLAKLQAFKVKYPNHVTVVDKPQNEGVAAARNSALDLARGEWIAFMDPDDALAEGAYGYLIDHCQAGDFDLLAFCRKDVELGDGIAVSDYELPLTYQVMWEGCGTDYLQKNHIGLKYGGPSVRLYKKSIIDRHHLRFKAFSIAEDILFNIEYLLADGIKVRKVDTVVYFYVKRLGSLSRTSHCSKLVQDIKEYMAQIEYLYDFSMSKENAVELFQLIKESVLQYYVPAIAVRLLKVNLPIREVNRIRKRLVSLGLFPYPEKALDYKILNEAILYPWLMPLLHLLYRCRSAIRK